MKKYMYLLLFVFLFMSYPNMTKANTCMNSEKVKWQELAKNVTTSYDYRQEGSTVIFSIKMGNVQPGLVIKDMRSGRLYNYSAPEIQIEGDFYQGGKYKFIVYTSDSNCSDIPLYTYYVNLPYYNPNYDSPLCEGIEEFKYCQKWTKVPDGDEWVQGIEEYKKSLEKKEEEPPQETRGFLEEILEIYFKYYYIIWPVIIIVGGIIIYRHNKKNDLF